MNDYKEEKVSINRENNDVNKEEISTSSLMEQTRILIENISSSKRPQKSLRDISNNLTTLENQDLTALILDTQFADLLISYIQDVKTSLISLHIVLILLKNSKNIVEQLYEKSIFQVLINELNEQKTIDITCYVCRCLAKCLKKFQEFSLSLTIDQNLFNNLFQFGTVVHNSYQKYYSKVIYLLIKYYDVSEFIDDILVQCMILMERRISSDSIKYVILQLKEIAVKYPNSIDEILEYPVVDILLESKIISTVFDANAIMNTIQAFIEIENAKIKEKVIEKLQINEIHEALKYDNQSIVESALDLIYCCLTHYIVSAEKFKNEGIIETLIKILDSGSVPAKVKDVLILMLGEVTAVLEKEQKAALIETGVDIIQELKRNLAKFVTTLGKFIMFENQEKEYFLSLYMELDIKDVLESVVIEDEETQVAIDQFLQLINEE